MPQKLESAPCRKKRDEKEQCQDADQQTAPPGKLVAKGKRMDMTNKRWLQPKPIRDGEHDAYRYEHDQIASPMRRWLNELVGHAHLTNEWTDRLIRLCIPCRAQKSRRPLLARSLLVLTPSNNHVRCPKKKGSGNIRFRSTAAISGLVQGITGLWRGT